MEQELLGKANGMLHPHVIWRAVPSAEVMLGGNLAAEAGMSASGIRIIGDVIRLPTLRLAFGLHRPPPISILCTAPPPVSLAALACIFEAYRV